MTSVGGGGGRKFLKPQDEDFADTSAAPSWKEDKSDVAPDAGTTFVYNASPSLALAAQRHRLPIAKRKNHILYMLEKFQVLIIVGESKPRPLPDSRPFSCKATPVYLLFCLKTSLA